MAEAVSTRCVREKETKVNGKLHHFFLCDECAKEWEAGPFSGVGAIEYGSPFDGYCRACSQVKKVRLRSWFLCEICKNVASSIGKSLISEAAVVTWWKRVETSFPGLDLVRNDVAALRPRSKTDKSAASKLDFLVRDRTSGEYLVGIEIKTGPGSAEEFPKFQLDVSDCEAILNQMVELGIPAFMFHVQVQEKWDKLPSVGFEAKGIWWTDMYAMTDHAYEWFSRADEKRPALNFRPAMFKPISEFPSECFADGTFPLVERYKHAGKPRILEVAEELRLAKAAKEAERKERKTAVPQVKRVAKAKPAKTATKKPDAGEPKRR